MKHLKNHGVTDEWLVDLIEDVILDDKQLVEEDVFNKHVVLARVDWWYGYAAGACVLEDWEKVFYFLRKCAECGAIMFRGLACLGEEIDIVFGGRKYSLCYEHMDNTHKAENWIKAAEAAIITGTSTPGLFKARREHFYGGDLEYKHHLRRLYQKFFHGVAITAEDVEWCESSIDEWQQGLTAKKYIAGVELDRAIVRLVSAASNGDLSDSVVREVVQRYAAAGREFKAETDLLIAFPVLMVLCRTEWRPSFESPYIPLQLLEHARKQNQGASGTESVSAAGTPVDCHSTSRDDCSLFLAHESALRGMHGDEHLYVKPKAYQRPDDSVVLVGGWVYADGNPAIIPPADIILLIETDGRSRPFEHDIAIEAFKHAGARVEIHFVPCKHVAIWAEDMTPLQIAKLWGYIASRMKN